MPCATDAEMYSKCGVSPLMTQPRHTTASYRPASAAHLAACGSSKAPGTSKTSMSLEAAPASLSAARAPSRSRRVTPSLKRETTIAKRRPEADGSGARAPGSAWRTDYFPLNSAFRFSRKALVPSRMSSVLATSPNRVASKLCASANGICRPLLTASMM